RSEEAVHRRGRLVVHQLRDRVRVSACDLRARGPGAGVRRDVPQVDDVYDASTRPGERDGVAEGRGALWGVIDRDENARRSFGDRSAVLEMSSESGHG